MEKFTALVAGRRAGAAAEEEEEGERDEAYLRIRLEEIVIVKNGAHDGDALAASASASAPRGANGRAVPASMGKKCACGNAIDATPAPGGGSATAMATAAAAAAAARCAWTAVTRIVGLD